MFKGAYFGPRYFASRYWAKVGSGVAVIIPADLVELSVRFRRSVTLAARFVRTVTFSQER